MHIQPRGRSVHGALALTALAMSSLFPAPAASQPASGAVTRTAPAPRAGAGTGATAGSAPAEAPQRLTCSSVVAEEPLSLALGKSRVIQLRLPAVRLIGGGRASSQVASAGEQLRPAPQVAGAQVPPAPPAPAPTVQNDGVADMDITLLSPTEVLVVGRRPGSANFIVQDREGRCTVRDVVVTADPATLQSKLKELLPNESGVRVGAAESAIVLTGAVTDLSTLDQVVSIASAYGDGKRVVNLMRVSAPQQVMLEVKIAEVSKTLLDKLGANVNAVRSASSGLNTYSLVSDFLSGGGGLLQAMRVGRGSITVDAEKDDGLVRVLAEPNIMAISGQAASFLSGGKIFIPVALTENNNGIPTIRLEEKEFGVGLKFTPTVLDGRINLKVTSEVSELSQTGSPFTTLGGVTAILPSMTTRRVDTTVQLGDGQSFVVAGLIKNNVTQALNRVPGLGEVPLVGALFRSTEFQNDQTELMFVVTPRLVKPIAGPVTVPTDNHVTPNRSDVMLRGSGEGSFPPPTTQPAAR